MDHAAAPENLAEKLREIATKADSKKRAAFLNNQFGKCCGLMLAAAEEGRFSVEVRYAYYIASEWISELGAKLAGVGINVKITPTEDFAESHIINLKW